MSNTHRTSRSTKPASTILSPSQAAKLLVDRRPRACDQKAVVDVAELLSALTGISVAQFLTWYLVKPVTMVPVRAHLRRKCAA